MPEVYPGMRIKLEDHDLTCYVEQVVHTCSRTSGFSTQLSVSAPVRNNGALITPEVGISKIHRINDKRNTSASLETLGTVIR